MNDSTLGQPVADVRLEGRVDTWINDRGFGFLVSGEQRYFAHISEFAGTALPQCGDVVRFEVGQRRGRELAVRVTIARREER